MWRMRVSIAFYDLLYFMDQTNDKQDNSGQFAYQEKPVKGVRQHE